MPHTLKSTNYEDHRESEEEAKALEALQIPSTWSFPGSPTEFQFKCSSERVPYLRTLALKHCHRLDSRIEFVEATHTYFIDGDSTGITSVSSLYKPYFPPFNSQSALDIVLDKLLGFLQTYGSFDKAMPYMDERYQRYCKMSPEEILTSWDENRDRAAARGTYCHLQAEKFCNSDFYDWDCREMALIRKFFFDHPYYIVIRTEHSIGIPEALLCGQVDVLLMDMRTGELVVGDFKFAILKTGVPFCTCPYDTDLKRMVHLATCEAWGCHPYTQSLYANDISKYSCQTNLYTEIYRRRYNLNPAKIILIVAQQTLENYIVVQVEFMREIVSRMIEDRINDPEVKAEVQRRLERNPNFLNG